MKVTIPHTSIEVELSFSVNEHRPFKAVMADFRLVTLFYNVFPEDEIMFSIYSTMWNTAYELSERYGDFTEFDSVNRLTSEI